MIYGERSLNPILNSAAFTVKIPVSLLPVAQVIHFARPRNNY
jgi:hypothetical protein